MVTAYDKKGNLLRVNSRVHWRKMQVIVVRVIDPNRIEVKVGGLIDIAKTCHVEVVQ